MRQAAPHRHGLRIAFFSVEEWGLTGSDQYLASLSPEDRKSIILNINLDTVVGGSGLTALTSGFPGLSAFLHDTAQAAGFELGIHEPLQRNSDHANFALRGIPAFRLLSGFDEPESEVRFVLTGMDRCDRIRVGDMAHAVALSTALTKAALNLDATIYRGWRV